MPRTYSTPSSKNNSPVATRKLANQAATRKGSQTDISGKEVTVYIIYITLISNLFKEDELH